MLESWIHFAIVIVAELFCFVSYAWYVKRLRELLQLFLWGAVIGITIGIPVDLIAGSHFGLYSFALGFGPFFLILNAIFSYGLFVANALLMQCVRFQHILLFTVLLTAVYEITNYFFRVWTWGFTLPIFEFSFLLVVGYVAGVITNAVIAHTLLGRRFAFLDTLLKK